ncbi:MAG: hypothetical protein HYU27_00840 [Acidobacteria bacterium]|nr:hypothetical protein [Acidobacteriota bacterium]
MKKIVLVAALVLAAMAAAAGLIVFRGSAAKEAPSSPRITEVSPKTAQLLQIKIDAIKAAEENAGRQNGGSRVEVSEAELESYVLYSLAEDIPATIDSIDVQLGANTVGADTQITFTSNATGNPVVDALVGGTHNLFLKGKLVTTGQGRGKFDLQEIRVDGIPVPNVLIQTLFKKYVKPKYPDADLNEPFDLPWGIEELKLESGKASFVY